MNEDKPDIPGSQEPVPREGGPPTEPRGGSMGLGTVLGALALYVLYLGGTIGFGGPYAWGMSFLAGPATFLPIVVYLAVAIVLAVRPSTSRWGTGLLIGLGIFTLLGGGLCVGALSQMRA